MEISEQSDLEKENIKVLNNTLISKMKLTTEKTGEEYSDSGKTKELLKKRSSNSKKLENPFEKIELNVICKVARSELRKFNGSK